MEAALVPFDDLLALLGMNKRRQIHFRRVQGQTGDDLFGLGVGEFDLTVLKDKYGLIGVFHQQAILFLRFADD